MSGLRHIVVTALVSACLCTPLAALNASAATTNPPAGGPATAQAAASGTVTISGKGFGHGVGLSQDGDLELGREGKKLPQILGYFYPGTRFGSASDVTIRAAVVEVDGHASIDVTLPAGGVVRVGSSGVSVAKGGTARLSHGGDGYAVRLLHPPKGTRPDTTSARGDTPYSVYSNGLELTAGSSYRGVLTVAADGSKLRAIDSLPIESYLYGLGEVRDPSWPQASLQAQVVAARSYALHSMHPGALFDVWSDDRSQVYLGASGEYAALTEAVKATRGLVLTYDGSVADTVYSASAGGVTATAAEGFGDDPTVAAGEPYLTAHAYPTADPLPWSVTYSLATVGAALDYPGTLTGLTVTSVGPSGRATGVTLTGSTGPLLVPGLALYHDLRLQSNLYTVAAAAAGTSTATIPAGTPSGGAGTIPTDAGPAGTSTAGASPAASTGASTRAGENGASIPHLFTGQTGATLLPTPSAAQTGPPTGPPTPVAASAGTTPPRPGVTGTVGPSRSRAVSPTRLSAASPAATSFVRRPTVIVAGSLWALAMIIFLGGYLRGGRARAAGG